MGKGGRVPEEEQVEIAISHETVFHKIYNRSDKDGRLEGSLEKLVYNFMHPKDKDANKKVRSDLKDYMVGKSKNEDLFEDFIKELKVLTSGDDCWESPVFSSVAWSLEWLKICEGGDDGARFKSDLIGAIAFFDPKESARIGGLFKKAMSSPG